MKKKSMCMASLLLTVLLLAGCGQAEAGGGASESGGSGSGNTVLESSSDASSSDAASSNAASSNTEQKDKTNTNAEEETATRDIFAMDTYMSVTAYGEKAQEAVDASVEEINRLDQLLSTGNSDSEVGKINANHGGTLSEDGAYLMEKSLELYQLTDGVFDISIYPVMDLWGFTTQDFAVPSSEDLKERLTLVDASKIDFDEETGEVSFEQDGMEIDFGGIAKGYTSNRVSEIFAEYGIKSGLINLGGNVDAYGSKTDGSAWRVAIQSPDQDGNYIGVLEAKDKAVITSGGYERYFEEDGITYHHIIDPSTGYPADSGLKSVTIICDDGTLADGLSTSLFIMGEEKASEFWREHSDEFDFVLMKEDGSLVISEGIEDTFTTNLETKVVRAKES